MNTQIIRCPVCLASQPVKKDISPNQQLHCGNCKRSFAVKNGLPLNEDSVVSYANSVPSVPADIINTHQAATGTVIATWIIGFIIWIFTISKARPYMATLNGPDFLDFYFIVFIAIIVILIVLRKFWLDTMHFSIIAFLIFEGIGLIRYIDASAAGMHKFLIMFIMMGVGGVLFFLRAHHMDEVDWSSDCSSCSNCSGCGGGGGCGGCGD